MIVPSVRSPTRDADDQAHRQQAVDDALPELRFRGEILVDVQRLGVHRQAAKEDVIGFGDGAPQRMPEGHAGFEVFVVFSGHCLMPVLLKQSRPA